MIYYKDLCADDIKRSLFDGFIRRQDVARCWRKENGKWIIKDAPFIDDWSENDYRKLISYLKAAVLSKGFVHAAFSGEKLKGFVSVDPEWLGEAREYLDLTNIYVSRDMRRCGIGRDLFKAAADWARKKGAGKLYISAHSAIESQAFYRSMGCTEAKTYSKMHVLEEPYDCQLEYSL